MRPSHDGGCAPGRGPRSFRVPPRDFSWHDACTGGRQEVTTMAPMTFLMQGMTPVASTLADPTDLFVLLGTLALAGVLAACAKMLVGTETEPGSRRAQAVRVVPRLAA